jgi:hypothetical protein
VNGAVAVRIDDEIIRETLVTRGGEVAHPRVKEQLIAVEDPKGD